MKRGTKLIALAAALALCVGLYFLVLALTSGDGGDAPGETTKEDPLVSLSGGITELSYEYNGERHEFVLEDSTWFYRADREMPLDQTKVGSLAELVKSAEVLRRIESGETGEYGLAAPRLKIEAAADGERVTILVGDENPAVSGFYAKAGDGMCLIGPELPRGFMIKLYSLVAADDYPSLNTTNLRGLSLKAPEGKLELFYSEEGSPKVYAPRYKWFSDSALTVPVRSDFATVLGGLIAELSYMECVSYRSDPAILSGYGLLEPATVFEYIYQDSGEAGDEPVYKTHRALIGAEAGEDAYYFTWDGTEMVYTLAAEDAREIISRIETDPSPKDICLVEPDEILKMTVSYGGKSAAITRNLRETTDSEGNKTTAAVYESGGTVIQSELAEAIITAFSGLSSEHAAAPQGGEEVLRIELETSRKGFEKLILTAYTHDSNFYRVHFTGTGQSQLVSLRTVETLGEAIAKVAK